MVTGKRQTMIYKTLHRKLKIPNVESEAVNQRTDNTMTTGKRTNNDLQNITQKTKDTKLVIRSCKSKDRQYNGHRKKDKQ
jgi:3'-phosphoadenosine 5'-phosphosulfate sulfotransferase